MASVIKDKNLQELELAKAQAPAEAPAAIAKASAPGGGGGSSASVANTSTSSSNKPRIPGASQNTLNMLSQYGQGYQQSGNVQAAQSYLNSILNNKPTADAQLSQLYDQIMNQQQFSYDMNSDVLYQQYKEQYQNMGRQAMMDTMGNATALTGGYGNSYASTAGNQAYQQYLQQLNDKVPELYKMAYDQYNQGKTDLLNQYNLAYGQHRDDMSDWENALNYANSEYWNQHNADYTDYQNMLNYWNQMAQQESAAYYAEREQAYNTAMAMIKKGTMPSEALLAMAGIDPSDAKKLAQKYGYGKSSGGSGGSSKKSSSSGGTKKPTSSGSSGVVNAGASGATAGALGTNPSSGVTSFSNLLQQYLSK